MGAQPTFGPPDSCSRTGTNPREILAPSVRSVAPEDRPLRAARRAGAGQEVAIADLTRLGGINLNRAGVYEEMGDVVKATADLRQALRLATPGPMRAEVERRLARLERAR